MPTRQGFQKLAAKLIGVSFSDFSYPCIFTNVIDWDNATQTETTETQTINAIRNDFNLYQFQQGAIQVGDFSLLLEFQKFTIPVRVDSTRCSYRGQDLAIIGIGIDSADAVISIHVRPL